MKRKLLALLVSMSMLWAALAGCGGDSTGNPPVDATDSPESSENPSVDEAAEKEDEPKTINVSWLDYNLNDDWFKSVLTFAQEEAKIIEQEDHVKFNFTLYDGAGNEETQISQVDDVITKHDADIIVFIPINEAAMAKAVAKLNNEFTDVPIGAAGVTASGGKYLYVGLDNVAATAQCGNTLVKLLSEKYGEDSAEWAKAGGVIVELLGPTGLKISQDRSEGFHTVMDPLVEKTPGLEIVQRETGWDPEKALEVMTDLVQMYGDKIIGIFSSDDTSATQGAWRALELNGMGYPVGDEKHIPIVTYDGTMNGMQSVRDGHIDMITEQPAFGYGHLLMRYLYNWYQDGYDSLPKPGTSLEQEDLSKFFDVKTGVEYWGPVEVREGESWEGIWLVPKSPIIPDELDPYSEYQWGNYLYYQQNGEYPKP